MEKNLDSQETHYLDDVMNTSMKSAECVLSSPQANNKKQKQKKKGHSDICYHMDVIIIVLFLLAHIYKTNENRIQIGTLKALGYSNIDIAKQYFYYGLLASIIGEITLKPKIVPIIPPMILAKSP